MNPTGSFASLDDWLPWLETLSPREIVLGLERVETVLTKLNLKRVPLIVNVAGTNGKGSCVAMLESLLRSCGYKTGSYTSPHLIRYNERIRIEGDSATDEQVLAGLRCVEDVRDEEPLTYFEFGTLAALVAFDSANVDAMVLEVGMGGRLDAVNAVEPDGCLITNVSLDHCSWLGDDVESIAAEKAGIMRAGKPVVFGSPHVPDAIRMHADRIGADLRLLGRDFSYDLDRDNVFSWRWQGRQIEFLELTSPALSGEIQLQNAAAVLAIVEALGLSGSLDTKLVDKSFASVNLPGRLQWIDRQPRWLLDVAHNAAASGVLAESIAATCRDCLVVGIVGMLQDKDVETWVAPLRESVDVWIAVTVEGNRAVQAQMLARDIANYSGSPCLIASNLGSAMQFAESRADQDDVIIVTGSFYIVGPALAALQADGALKSAGDRLYSRR